MSGDGRVDLRASLDMDDEPPPTYKSMCMGRCSIPSMSQLEPDGDESAGSSVTLG